MGPFKDIGVEMHGFVALIEIQRPPNNFFDIALIKEITPNVKNLGVIYNPGETNSVANATPGKRTKPLNTRLRDAEASKGLFRTPARSSVAPRSLRHVTYG